MTEMKICVDCQHHSGGFCERPTGERDVVTGEFLLVSLGCRHERKRRWLEGNCGPRARYFEPKSARRRAMK